MYADAVRIIEARRVLQKIEVMWNVKSEMMIKRNVNPAKQLKGITGSYFSDSWKQIFELRSYEAHDIKLLGTY